MSTANANAASEKLAANPGDNPTRHVRAEVRQLSGHVERAASVTLASETPSIARRQSSSAPTRAAHGAGDCKAGQICMSHDDCESNICQMNICLPLPL